MIIYLSNVEKSQSTIRHRCLFDFSITVIIYACMVSFADMRKPYRSSEDIFDVNNLVSKNPIKQFESWFNEAREVPNIGEANAMALATATK